MKYYVIRKRVVSKNEQEADQIISVVSKKRIAVDICKRFPNLGWQELEEGKGKYLYD